MGTATATIMIAGRTVTIEGITSDDEKLAKLIALSTEVTVSITVRATPEIASLVGQLQYCAGTEVVAPILSANELTDEHIRALSMTTREYLRARANGDKASITRMINVLSDEVQRANDYAERNNEPKIEQLEYIWQVCRETEVSLCKERRFGNKSIYMLGMALKQTGLRLGMKDEIAQLEDRLPKHEP